ncbi:MAG: hypothetical protein GC185_04480 [Alphaproteobacteria bacterium]|nr:hypothetical protein [Alphaproteobacteria bacterium]
MAQDTVKMRFTDDVIRNEAANNGIGEFQARFIIVHPGEEEKAESLMKAFKTAGSKTLHERGGIVTLSQKNMEFRIAQLKSLPAHAETVSELQRGLEKVKQVIAEAKAGVKTAPAKKQQAGMGAGA